MDYNTLLQQAQKLTNETQANEGLPRMDRTLSQVLQATQELHNRITKTQDIQDIQAHKLFLTKGVDLSKISQQVEALSARKTFEPLDPISETDIQSFLRNERENSILSVIEEVHKNTYKAAQNQKWNHIMTDWKQEKIKLMNALIGPSQNWIDIKKVPEQTILNETTFGKRSTLNHQETAYAREVYDYNKILIEGGLRPSLVQRFSKVAESFNDSKINDMWEIMKFMTNTDLMPRTQDPIKTRTEHYQVQLIQQSKKYLETRYRLYIQTVIADHLRDAERGGVPSTVRLVSAFVNLRFNVHNSIGLQDGQVDGRPLWPTVYYLLRCGDTEAAVHCVRMAASDNELLISIMEERARSSDPQKTNSKELQLKMLYKRQVRNTTDPYKRAVYCLAGSCDVSETHPEVAKTSDDFLWLQLSMIRLASAPEDAADTLTYSGLQTMILEQYGEKHFNAAEQPHLYFQVLALTGQFEASIEFLSRTEKYRSHAVHIALALNEAFFISGPRNVQEPLLSVDIEDPQPMRRLNLARLILLYVKKFEVSDPAEALQYFYFLRNLRDPSGRNLFLVCISGLAIECRDYDLLFGKVQPNGIRTRGLIDQFESVDVDAKIAANLVAEELVKKGNFEDAVKLFDLAGNYEQAIHYTSLLLSQVVHQQNQSGCLRERIVQRAHDLAERYASTDFKCLDPQVLNTFNLMRDLAGFFEQYFVNDHYRATDILQKTKLVPMNMSQVDMAISNFKKLSGEVSKVFPDVLLAAMDILYKKYKVLKTREQKQFDSKDGHEKQLKFVREGAKALTNMAAMIPYRMPGDTNNRLVQTEILMN